MLVLILEMTFFSGVAEASEMRDLKQCLLDLLRSGGIQVGDNNTPATTTHYKSTAHKPKKLHEYTAADCDAAFLRKYHDQGIGGNIIYFNENLSMTRKYDMRHYPSDTRFSRSACQLSNYSMSGDSISPQSSTRSRENADTESERYFSSEYSERQTSPADAVGNSGAHNSSNKNSHNSCCQGEGDANAEAQLDSFCTLCTSTFSYNKCYRYCENSLCGSKCNSERGSRDSRLSRGSSSGGGGGLNSTCAARLHGR